MWHWGMGIFNVRVARLPSHAPVPHTGWNSITDIKGPLFEDWQAGDDCYFVHSYYAPICQDTIAVTNYILPISAAVQKNNFYATQFHPEKSGKNGDQILKNFLSL
jgi:glutamine amidotransferase